MARKEKVTKVIAGDTFMTDSREHAVRLANVDAPETGRPGAVVAKKKLEGLIADKEVLVQAIARDVYGRSIANVKVGRRSINEAMRSKSKK